MANSISPLSAITDAMRSASVAAQRGADLQNQFQKAMTSVKRSQQTYQSAPDPVQGRRGALKTIMDNRGEDRSLHVNPHDVDYVTKGMDLLLGIGDRTGTSTLRPVAYPQFDFQVVGDRKIIQGTVELFPSRMVLVLPEQEVQDLTSTPGDWRRRVQRVMPSSTPVKILQAARVLVLDPSGNVIHTLDFGTPHLLTTGDSLHIDIDITCP